MTQHPHALAFTDQLSVNLAGGNQTGGKICQYHIEKLQFASLNESDIRFVRLT